MSSNAEQIATIKSQTLARIAEITAQPKPTYQIDGQLVAWGDYLTQLSGLSTGATQTWRANCPSKCDRKDVHA